MKSVKEILRSPGFMREVSILLFGFAALGGLFAIILLTLATSDPDAVSLGLAFVIQSIVYLALGMMIRRGSVVALCVTGALFYLGYHIYISLPVRHGVGRYTGVARPSNLSINSLYP